MRLILNNVQYLETCLNQHVQSKSTIPMVLLYMVLHGSHQQKTQSMLAFFYSSTVSGSVMGSQSSCRFINVTNMDPINNTPFMLAYIPYMSKKKTVAEGWKGEPRPVGRQHRLGGRALGQVGAEGSIEGAVTDTTIGKIWGSPHGLG